MKPPDLQGVVPKIVVGDLTEELVQAYLKGHDLAVDTETMGLQATRDRLCLVQLCDRDQRAVIVQIPPENLSSGLPPATRAPNLKRLLEEPRVLKVLHFARFDLAMLSNWLGIRVSPIFCTRTASKLVRTYSDRHGLRDNLLEFFDVDLDKNVRHSDWSGSELTPTQAGYAISDVTMLLPLMDKLESMLLREHRHELARECFRAIPTLAALDVLGFTNLFEH